MTSAERVMEKEITNRIHEEREIWEKLETFLVFTDLILKKLYQLFAFQ